MLWEKYIQQFPSNKAPPTKGCLSYQARFQMHSDSKSTKLSPTRESTPLIKRLIHLRGGLIRGVILNCYNETIDVSIYKG